MRLRGYDEYEVTLGDEMRGERASIGKTIEDAERDLRIRAHIIRAIEDCDLDGFPNDSVVAGYVRSYSRYLGLDPEDCYHRFCAESGFRSPSGSTGRGNRAESPTGLQTIAAAGAAIGGGLTQSRFAVKSAPVNIGTQISLGGIASGLALIALVAGLGYGGYALLQDIQRVGFSPLPEAPEVVADAPLITPPTVEGGLLRRPDADAYAGGGVLAAVPTDLPPLLPSRDGPIADIDPETSGIYKVHKPEPEPELTVATDQADPRLAGPAWGRVVEPPSDPLSAPVAAAAPAVAAQVAASGPPDVAIHATNTAWIRVRDGEEAIVFEGILQPGDRFALPDRVADPMLRAGNAGAVFVVIDGITYGPVGSSGSVVKNVSLRADDVAEAMPEVNAETIGASGAAPVERAQAEISQ
ncbi:MAG: helix-turn-helix domain-containing protein [Paracoccaceae bacterium]|nr:helix-turn-helix domain-containing protein [Paracoccaceae bacterium]